MITKRRPNPSESYQRRSARPTSATSSFASTTGRSCTSRFMITVRTKPIRSPRRRPSRISRTATPTAGRAPSISALPPWSGRTSQRSPDGNHCGICKTTSVRCTRRPRASADRRHPRPARLAPCCIYRASLKQEESPTALAPLTDCRRTLDVRGVGPWRPQGRRLCAQRRGWFSPIRPIRLAPGTHVPPPRW